MSKTIIQNKLNHKPQAHARMCEENVGENKDCRVKYFRLKDRLWKVVEEQ